MEGGAIGQVSSYQSVDLSPAPAQALRSLISSLNLGDHMQWRRELEA